jgi:peptidoglycan/xylan/chitin deacetylase (PgdA/CDA1 family)
MIASLPRVFGGVRRAAKQTLFSVGYYHQRLSQLEFPGVAILCYHGIRTVDDARVPFNDLHVYADVFEAHCRFISAACNPISLDDLRASLDDGQALPARPVMVTFDDGYRSVLDYALPSLERYGIPAAVFVCSDPVLRSQHFWFDTLSRRDGEEAVLRAQTLPYKEWCALRESISTRADERETHRPMTAAELLRLATSPLIEIGGHTLSHPALAVASIDDQHHEILGCRIALQDAVGKPVDGFAYPFGRLRAHYGPETVGIVRNAGFGIAFTTEPSFQSSRCHRYEVPRFLMLDAVDDVELAHRLTHSWHTTETGV